MKGSVRSIIAAVMIILLAGIIFSGCAEKPASPDNKDGAADQEMGSGTDSGEDPGTGSKYSKEELLNEMNEVPMEDFELPDLKGNKVKLSDFKGKVVFLNFWATWCPPCRGEMPDMQKVYEGNEDVAIVAVNSTTLEMRGGDDSKKAAERAKAFIKENGYTFPVLLDGDNEVAGIYNGFYPLQGIPTTFIIDKEGIIRYVIPGAFKDEAQMMEYVEKIRAIE